MKWFYFSIRRFSQEGPSGSSERSVLIAHANQLKTSILFIQKPQATFFLGISKHRMWVKFSHVNVFLVESINVSLASLATPHWVDTSLMSTPPLWPLARLWPCHKPISICHLVFGGTELFIFDRKPWFFFLSHDYLNTGEACDSHSSPLTSDHLILHVAGHRSTTE